MKAVTRLDGWTVSAAHSRREFLGLLGAGLLCVYPSNRLPLQSPDSLPGTGPSGRLWDPSRAGRPLSPVAAADNDAAIQGIEKQLRCTCGCNLDVYTCRTTDFTCVVSPAMHREVVALAERGQTGQQIVDQFVREHGVAILMAPPKRGFNLAGYLVPSLLIIAAGVVLTLVLRRWTQAASLDAAAPAGAPGAAGTPEELARLRRELDRLSV